MRFPTAILAATSMIALTLVLQPSSADFQNPALYTAFDNHLLSDPTEAAFANLGLPSAMAGCSATERQLYSGGVSATVPPPVNKTVGVGWKNTRQAQVIESMGGCLALPATVPSLATCGVNATVIGCHPYHANIASLAGADDNLGWNFGDAQVCFYDAAYVVIQCDGNFMSDDTHGGPCVAQGQADVQVCADDSITQHATQYNNLGACTTVFQSVPAGAAFFDIEAPTGSVNVISAFWQDPVCA